MILELMARGGMRIGEVLGLIAMDIDYQKLIVRNPRRGEEFETVFIPKRLAVRQGLCQGKDAGTKSRIFPITYSAVRVMVRKERSTAGQTSSGSGGR
jgi:integrase